MVSLLLGLTVNITVDYNPPPDTHLGPSEYRAASGPVTVTCNVVGEPLNQSMNYQYQWSSSCSDCPFQNGTSENRIRGGAVNSGDTGTYTCTVTDDEESFIGNASIDFRVVGKLCCIEVNQCNVIP